MTEDFGVYRIVCKNNGMFYIGSSRQVRGVEYRFLAHLSELRRGVHSNSLLQLDFFKYGEESFDFEVLENCEFDACREREQVYLHQFFSESPELLYNRSASAYGASYVQSKDQIDKRITTRRANSVTWHSDETAKKIGASQLGRTATDETKARMSAAHTGREITWGDKISEAMTGKKKSAEHCRKMSEQRIGVPTGRIGKPVRCIENGVIYKNTVEAAEAMGLAGFRAISSAISKKSKCAGYHWEYANS